MTIKFTDYVKGGSWELARCDSCGREARCLIASGPDPAGDPETFAWCFVCIVKHIEQMEIEQTRMFGEDG
jgi:hypothetical protein